MQRIRNMSMAELIFRARQTYLRTVDFLLGWTGNAELRQSGLRAWPGLSDAAADAAHDATVVGEWREHAREVLAGRYSHLGVDWPHTRTIPDWHLDPSTGRYWPARTFAFAIDYRRSTTHGDVKLVWELNRLQYLVSLAALATTGPCDAARRCCLDHMDSWIEANPPLRGINWSSGIEIGLRALSILLVLSLLQPHTIDPDRRRRLLGALAAHGRWLARYPARYSSANNHLVAEAAALFVLGSLAPQLAAADEWRRHGRAVLLAEVGRQFLDDGVGAEQSPTYAAFSLELFALAGDLSERLGDGMPDAYWRRLEAAGEHLRALLDRGGHHPRIGDDDEGRVIAGPGREPSYVGSVLSMLGAMRGRPDLAPPRPARALRNVLFGAAPPYCHPPQGVRRFPTGGYIVARSRVGHSGHGREVLFVVDHGPLGFLSIAAHGHADALALWLHVDGEPVLIDAGTYRYYDAGPWRDHFRGTGAHNTLCLGGRDSSRIAGRFNWSEKARVEVVEWSTPGPDIWSLTARHDGYRRRFGCDHERTIRQRGPDRFEVVDRLIGASAPRPVEIGFLVAPGLSVTATGQDWRIERNQRPLLTIGASGPLTGSIREGSTGPRVGWCSTAYGDLTPTRRLVFSGDLAPGDAATFELLVEPGGG
jgi:hypothetical protein